MSTTAKTVAEANAIVGRSVVKARAESGLPRAAVVAAMRELGWSNWYINTLVRIEQGRQPLQPLQAPHLAAVLGADFAEFLPRLTEEVSPAGREIARNFLLSLGILEKGAHE